jgi:hypothetical protein
MHEMAWISTQGQAVGWVKLAARVHAHGNDVMDLQAAPTLSACPARRMAGQVLRSNAGPLAGSPDFGGLEEPAEEAEHHALPRAVLNATTAAENAAAWVESRPVPMLYILMRDAE